MTVFLTAYSGSLLALCSFDMEHSLGVVPAHNVDLQALLSVAVLLNLVFSLMPPAVFVLPPDESLEQGRNRTRMLTCVTPGMLLSLVYLLIDVVFSFLFESL